MGFVELFLLAVGLSMDAFAVAICKGLTMTKANMKRALIVGMYFGAFQAGMPLIGYFTARIFSDAVTTYSHWIAFGLLCILGGKMVLDGLKKESCTENSEQSIKPAQMLPLAIATSVDALAVGVSFAVLNISIVPAVSLIGIITLVISMIGVKIGSVFGARFKSKAQIFGGVILILIGLNVLLQHRS